MKLVLLGPSGAGKGTQAKNLAKYYKIPHVSTGDILRDHMKRETELGLQIAGIMDKGSLVEDDIVITQVQERIAEPDCEGGFIIDGFPRTLYQAEVLEDLTGELTRVVSINLDDDIIIKRMSGRYSCPDCGAVYHILYYPPKKTGICDVCGKELIQREDDAEATVVNRLRIYHEMTEPIKAFFKAKGLLTEVDGQGEAGEITGEIVKALEEWA